MSDIREVSDAALAEGLKYMSRNNIIPAPEFADEVARRFKGFREELADTEAPDLLRGVVAMFDRFYEESCVGHGSGSHEEPEAIRRARDYVSGVRREAGGEEGSADD